jgi:hypothetical protein
MSREASLDNLKERIEKLERAVFRGPNLPKVVPIDEY